jgi:starch phosphorylase
MQKTQDKKSTVAYFSMEVGIEPAIPTYSGGLGILAGDTLRAAADLGLTMIGITLLYRKGYIRQQLRNCGEQIESPVIWSPQNFLKPLPQQVSVEIEGRPVYIRPWVYIIRGINGHNVPIYFLDTDLPDNDPQGRALTDHLNGGDNHNRLCQEAILGLGGISILRAL